MIPQPLAIALATLASEDLACIATGVLIAQGQLGFTEGVLACTGGILAGDVMLFLLGRLAGATALQWPPLARFLPPARVEHAAQWINRRGLAVVFLSRFTPGLRLPTYFAAGLLRTGFWRFTALFALAAALWTPLLVASAMFFGQAALRAFFTHQGESLLASAALVSLALLLLQAARIAFSAQRRRRFSGRLQRLLRWEFWPAWAAYLPLIPGLLWLAWRHRSLTLFTAANPGIPTGGLFGESKSQILSPLGSAAASWDLIRHGLSGPARVAAAQEFLSRHNLQLPVVLKPDVGERGQGVMIARTREELEFYLHGMSGDVIIQRYVGGLEFGVFYHRLPSSQSGSVTSITAKTFPVVVGDGQTPLRDLILRDARAVCMAAAYQKLCRRPMHEVPARGETVQLVEIGSHCRGAIFSNGAPLWTPALEAEIDRISKLHPGFAFGRFDLRVPSAEDFRSGRNLQVIELNGVGAEATHVYDPSVSLWAAYSAMYTHWRLAFEIGAVQRRRGAQPVSLGTLLRLWRQRPGIRSPGAVQCVPAHTAQAATPTGARRDRDLEIQAANR
ncbi:VTT domain-containing protein [Paludibaculum fermentans]|uniref:DedA family protein n=1 Tax=Paludibaculum fermentans TaxID=1473598 RepID=UPI003EBF4EBE